MRSDDRYRLRSMHCPNCDRLISMASGRCIHCGLPYPRLFVSLPLLGDLVRGRVSFSNAIVTAAFTLYVLALALDLTSLSLAGGGGLFNLLAPTGEALLRLGMGGAVPVLGQGRWWTLVTATYLHGSILHIGFNMLWLRQIGPLVEELYGASRFFIIYTAAGVAGALLSTLLGTPFFVGASGSIFGLFAALIYYGRHRGGTFGEGIFRTMLIWAAIGFLFGLVSPNIDNWGHAGGFAGGLLAALALGYQERYGQRLWQHVLAFGLVIAVGIAFLAMVVNFFLG